MFRNTSRNKKKEKKEEIKINNAGKKIKQNKEFI